ncbi:hypothetical protein V5O48_004072 [Marasmius crinis-equi]|uniref:C2H2-type domain-containing protein n=1 Tax=Marasmius crinis-equi TaxID=585013 RepID=A0ABR3FR53_9AGAR
MLPASLPRPVPCHFATSCDPSSDINRSVNASNRSFNPSRPRLAVSDKLSDSFYRDIAHLDSPAYSSSPSDTHTLDDESLPSPPPVQAISSPNYHYVNCGSVSFGSPSESSKEMYESDPPTVYTTTSSPPNIYNLSPPGSAPSNYSIGTVTDIRESDPPTSYHSNSPSPGDVHSADFFYSSANPPSQDRFPSLSSSLPADPDQSLSHNSQLLPENDPNNSYVARASSSNYSAPPPQTHSALSDRRMSEPAILATPNPYSSPSDDSGSPSSTSRYPYSATMSSYNGNSRSAYLANLHRGSSIGSLRELRNQDVTRSGASFHGNDTMDSPLSPFQSGFAGGSPLSQYAIAEGQYGTSPSEAGFSPAESEANVGGHPADRQGRTRSSTDPSSKTYSFVALPGNAVKKRPRRRYDEIERLYQCSWPDCNKSYGTLNHLNAHVTMQKHGPKRSPNEFKELRKQWRKAKKETEAAASAAARRSSMGSMMGDEHEFYDSHYSSPPQRFTFPGQNLSSAIPISPRYGVSGDEYYSTGERTERGIDYSSLAARPRYGESANSSSAWSHGLTPSARSSHSLPVMSSSLPSQPSYSYSGQNHNLHPLDPPSFQSGGSPDRPLSIPSPPQMMTGRLPPNSTLLTPLPGYEARETLPPLQMGGNMTYESETYYDGEGGRRSSSGHASAGRPRGDDF